MAGIGFYYEAWRAPFAALHVIANDPAWLVSEQHPDTLGRRQGMFGPVRFTAEGVAFGAYIRDEDRFEEVIKHTRRAIRLARKQRA